MPRSSHPKRRVGLREVAAAADVCVMTVSLALRGNPRISAPTRERIQRLAQQLGYQPDAELSRLMNHLRVSRVSRGRVGVALVDFYPELGYPENAYNAMVRASTLRRAEELGIALTAMHAIDYQLNTGQLMKVLRARGLEGAVLLPSVVPLALTPDTDWAGISVITTSKSILSPRFHCVVPDHFGNTMRLFAALRVAGCHRVCAVFDEQFDERTAHGFTAAVSWHGQAPLTLIVPNHLGPRERSALARDWLAEHRPDAVFGQSNAVSAAIPELRKLTPRWNPHVVSLGEHNSAGFSFIDERADLVGTAAMDLLAAMMYFHETGIPAHARTTTIGGRLQFGPKLFPDT